MSIHRDFEQTVLRVAERYRRHGFLFHWDFIHWDSSARVTIEDRTNNRRYRAAFTEMVMENHRHTEETLIRAIETLWRDRLYYYGRENTQLAPSQITAAAIDEYERHVQSIGARTPFHQTTEAQWRGQEQKRTSQSREAEDKARQLLLNNLTEEQRKEFEKNCEFRVKSKNHANVEYVLTKSHTYSVYVHMFGKRIGKLCVVSKKEVPIYDQMLAQKLMLETDEDSFISKSNFGHV